MYSSSCVGLGYSSCYPWGSHGYVCIGSHVRSDTDSLAVNREAQRKATHNEGTLLPSKPLHCYHNCLCCTCTVERRRRDRINDMIKTLAQIVPGCQKKDSTTGSVVGVSILSCLCGRFVLFMDVVLKLY